VLEQAFEHLHRCGDGRRECVVYLTGPVDAPDLIDGVIHPHHTASAAGYDLDSAAIGELWTTLASERRSIRLQAHTHPGAAYHSSRDDTLAILSTPGFLSLVIPNFARGPVTFANAFLAERDDAGGWRAVSIPETIELLA
jgi:hypothetical protein